MPLMSALMFTLPLALIGTGVPLEVVRFAYIVEAAIFVTSALRGFSPRGYWVECWGARLARAPKRLQAR